MRFSILAWGNAVYFFKGLGKLTGAVITADVSDIFNAKFVIGQH
jgi:hypothetical protein